jgi:autotransporter-associated beta strand protein
VNSGTNGTSAALFVNSAIFVNAGDSVVGGLLNVGSGTQNIFFPVGSIIIGAPTLTVNAEISGSAYIQVTGNSGTMFLNRSNSFTGPFSVGSTADPGLLVHLGNDFSLGAVTAGSTNEGPRSGFFIDLAVANISEPLTLCGYGPFGTDGAIQISGSANWNTNVVLACDTMINCSPSSFLTINGGISGTGSLTKIGTGTLTFSGSPANTYVGSTTNAAGTLRFNKTTIPAFPGGQLLVIGDGLGGEDADVVLYLADAQILSSSSIMIKSSGLLNLNGFDEPDIGAFTLDGGDIDTAGGLMTMFGNVTVPGSITNVSTIDGRIALSGTRTFNITNGTPSIELQIGAEVSGSGAIIKGGSGAMSLISSNTFTGAITVNDGVLRLQNDFAAGTTAGGVVVNGDSILQLNLGINVGAEALTLNSTSPNAIQAFNGSNSWAGAVTLSIDSTVYVDPADTLNFLGAISGAGGVTKISTGTLYYSGASANTYAGTTKVNAGTLILDKSALNGAIAGPGGLIVGDGAGGVNADVVRLSGVNQIVNTVPVTVASSGLYDMAGFGDAIGSLSGSGNVTLGSATMNVGFDNTTATFDGIISGTGGIDKFTGTTGTQILNGNNTYSGLTTVDGGTLVVNGSQPQSAVSVGTSGTLAGSGTVGVITGNGAVAPGSSPGILTSSNVTFAATGNYFVDLTGPDAGTDYDQLNIRGTSSLGGALLHVNAAFTTPVALSNQFVIVNNDGADAIIGTFSGLANGATFSVNNYGFRINYNGGISANDVVLTVTSLPGASAGSTVTLGNGNGTIDPNECNYLNVVITNKTGTTMTGITATLASETAGVVVTQPSSTYANVPGNGKGTNVAPFQVSTSPSFICGSDVNLLLSVITATHGAFSVPVVLKTGSPGNVPVRYDVSATTNIPDVGTIESTNTVVGFTGPLTKVGVSLWLTHTLDADLSIGLVSPDGVFVDLSSGNGGSGDDYGINCSPDASRTTFDDAAGTAITAGAAPFVGTFHPEGSLATLIGGSANGNWRLRVTDANGGSLGTLRCWSLFLYPAACAAGSGQCELCPDVTIYGAVTTNSPTLSPRMFRDATSSTCGAPKTCPGTSGGAFNYESYTFRNGPSAACITVTLTAPVADLFSAAYTNSFNPAVPCENYLADAGDSTTFPNILSPSPTRTYSFNVSANQVFVVIVNNATGPPGDFSLSVTGGDCRPALNISPVTPNQVKLDWTTAAAGYQLERTNNLLGSANWPPVTNTPAVINSRFAVTNSTALTNEFFRLRKP